MGSEPAHSDSKAATVDGSRTPISKLNVDIEQQASANRFRRLWQNINRFLAGMYIGEKCAGTPHEHHSYRKDD